MFFFKNQPFDIFHYMFYFGMFYEMHQQKPSMMVIMCIVVYLIIFRDYSND